jgi:dihydrofolate reductase
LIQTRWESRDEKSCRRRLFELGRCHAGAGRAAGGPHGRLQPRRLDGHLLGRKTYEIFAAHWPFVEGSDPTAALFNRVTKYVATSSEEPLTWTNTVALRGDVAAEITRLKQEDGPTLLTQGSSVLLQTLLAHDLIDEFRLLIFPLVLGPGKRLFGQGTKPGALKLTATTVSTTGVIMSVYDRAGAISTGSFELPHPSEAEIARRARMQREG